VHARARIDRPSIPAVRLSDPPRRSLEHRGAGPRPGPAPVFAVSRTVVWGEARHATAPGTATPPPSRASAVGSTGWRSPQRCAATRATTVAIVARAFLVVDAFCAALCSELSLSKELGAPAGLDGCSSGAAARRFAPSPGAGAGSGRAELTRLASSDQHRASRAC
jgi:hypothetical protein